MTRLALVLMLVAACGDDLPAPAPPDAEPTVMRPDRPAPHCPVVACHPDAGVEPDGAP